MGKPVGIFFTALKDMGKSQSTAVGTTFFFFFLSLDPGQYRSGEDKLSIKNYMYPFLSTLGYECVMISCFKFTRS